MISCYLESRSQQKSKLRKHKESELALKNFTIGQLQSFQMLYDDVVYQNKIVNKFMLCGIIISYRDGLSPTKKPIRIIKLKDSTGTCQLQMFQSRQWSLIPDLIQQKPQQYVTVCAQARVQGQFKYEIKHTVNGINTVHDYNQITIHMLSAIQDYINIKS